jgi:serine/threonine-protein kinase
MDLPALDFVTHLRVGRYREVLGQSEMVWPEYHRLQRRLGSGGQGVVFLCEREGADGFHLPVAVKVFSPERFETDEAYDEAMARMARVAVDVAQIQHDNLLDVHNVVAIDGIRVMEMEWIDGYDLGRLLTTELLDELRRRVSETRWAYINDVIVTGGVSQPRLKPGIAIAVLRDALAALAALHHNGIVHGDVKPSNLMLKRTGNAKLIDIGAAFRAADPPPTRTCTPAYAAPEVLQGEVSSPLSDLASLGYVLIEMLAGESPFGQITEYAPLLAAKRAIVDRLTEMLPEDVVRNDLLMNLIRGMIAPDPADRFPSAETADLMDRGAASFQRQLVKSNLASEYDIEIRAWLAELD